MSEIQYFTQVMLNTISGFDPITAICERERERERERGTVEKVTAYLMY